jgi:hypothetical protein
MVALLMDFEKNKMIGLLYITSPEEYYFDEKDIIHLEGLTELIAMAIIPIFYSLDNILLRRKNVPKTKCEKNVKRIAKVRSSS